MPKGSVSKSPKAVTTAQKSRTAKPVAAIPAIDDAADMPDTDAPTARPTVQSVADNGVRHGVLVPISALAPHPENYNFHPEEQLDDLMESLLRYGQVASIVVQEGAPGRYLIVAGHGLTEAATKLGLTELFADVIPANWTRAQVIGYMISDNETARRSKVDERRLAQLIEEQRAAGYDLSSLGVTAEQYDAMLERLMAGPDIADGEDDSQTRDVDDPSGGGDDFDTTPASGPTRTRRGDLFQLGGYTVCPKCQTRNPIGARQ